MKLHQLIGLMAYAKLNQVNSLPIVEVIDLAEIDDKSFVPGEDFALESILTNWMFVGAARHIELKEDFGSFLNKYFEDNWSEIEKSFVI